MEGKPAKRRRVYSIEPKKVVEAVFTRNYLNYLVPVLMKIKERSSKAEQQQQNKKINCDDVVKHEVEMAMVFSAQGFAWSNALKTKLQQREVLHTNPLYQHESRQNEESEGTDKIYDHQKNEMAPQPPTPLVLPCSKFLGDEILVSSNKDMAGIKKKDLDREEEELMRLRKLIPGGEEMCNEEMVGELESYISCLQMQVNILQYLAGTS